MNTLSKFQALLILLGTIFGESMRQ